jgi:hypothetical protein
MLLLGKYALKAVQRLVAERYLAWDFSSAMGAQLQMALPRIGQWRNYKIAISTQ